MIVEIKGKVKGSLGIIAGIVTLWGLVDIYTFIASRTESQWYANLAVAIIVAACLGFFIAAFRKTFRSVPSPTPDSGEVHGDGQKEKPVLGLVVIEPETFEHDLAIADRFQAFSAELLRLALLGVAGVGFLVVNLDPGRAEEPSGIQLNLATLEPFAIVTVIFLGVCCAAALGHRYLSGDGLACHLNYIRLIKAGEPATSSQVAAEKQGRSRRWGVSTVLLAVAAASLGAGAASLAAGFLKAFRLLSEA